MPILITFNDFQTQLNETKQLANDAEAWASLNWATISVPKGVGFFKPDHTEMMTEMALLRSFLYWEAFLEESFICYLMGEVPPNGVVFPCYVTPPNRDHATRVAGDGRIYADWTNLDDVIDRAERYFDAGEPYKSAIISKKTVLKEIKTIRNAIAHMSANSQDKFRILVRNKIGRYPTGITIGKFLAMTIPSSSPPRSFLDEYIEVLKFLSETIVPK